MVVDTSAVIAILNGEADADNFIGKMESDTLRLISAVSVLEAGIIAHSRKGDEGAAALDGFLREAELEIQPFDAEQAFLARRAYVSVRSGRGISAGVSIRPGRF